jgi:hypothetical protein
MIILTDYKIRNDGVKLVQRYSGEYAEDGTIIRTNFMLHKIGTEEYYAEPIDVEDASWEYEETNIPVETHEPHEPEGRDNISDAEFRRLVEEAL